MMCGKVYLSPKAPGETSFAAHHGGKPLGTQHFPRNKKAILKNKKTAGDAAVNMYCY